jgi:hypothetical protein
MSLLNEATEMYTSITGLKRERENSYSDKGQGHGNIKDGRKIDI